MIDDMTDLSVSRGNAGRRVAALVALGVVPVLAGGLRLAELAGGAAVTPDNARFLAAPVPVVLHIIGASVYAVLGAFQFLPRPRRGGPRRHRVAGRLLVPCGLVAALAGMWMTVFSPLPEHDGPLLAVFRLVFGTAMAAALVLGLVAARRRDFTRHRAWMIRGYAIGLGAGTQALTQAPWYLLAGVPGEFAKALLLGAGWVINLVVAEWVIRRPPARLSS